MLSRLSAEVSLQSQSDQPSTWSLRLTPSLTMRIDRPTRTSILKTVRCLKAQRKLHQLNSTAMRKFLISIRFHLVTLKSTYETKKNQLQRAKPRRNQKLKRLLRRANQSLKQLHQLRTPKILNQRLQKDQKIKALKLIPQKVLKGLLRGLKRNCHQ